MKAIDICAGAGGLSLGLQRAGFDVHGVELRREAAALHMQHVGPCDLADVATWHPQEPVDLVIGGIPCQPFKVDGDQWKGCVRMTVEQCAVLQGFPAGWSWPKPNGVAFELTNALAR